LKAVPDIGAAYSEKIIKGRLDAQKDGLVQKELFPVAACEQVKYKILPE
jgi:hypothetical protein